MNSARFAGSRRNAASISVRPCQIAFIVRAVMPSSSECSCMTRKASSSADGRRKNSPSSATSSRPPAFRKCSSIGTGARLRDGNSFASMVCSTITFSWVVTFAVR